MKQCEAIQVGNIESQGEDTPKSKKLQIQIKDGLFSSYECADGRDARRSDGCIRGERCELRCVHFQEPNVMTSLGTGKVELDFMSWLDVKIEYVKQPEYRSRLCRKEIERWDPTVLERSHEYVMFLCTKAMTWRSRIEWVVGTKDHVFRCVKSSVLGGCHERDGN